MCRYAAPRASALAGRPGFRRRPGSRARLRRPRCRPGPRRSGPAAARPGRGVEPRHRERYARRNGPLLHQWPADRLAVALGRPALGAGLAGPPARLPARAGHAALGHRDRPVHLHAGGHPAPQPRPHRPALCRLSLWRPLPQPGHGGKPVGAGVAGRPGRPLRGRQVRPEWLPFRHRRRSGAWLGLPARRRAGIRHRAGPQMARRAGRRRAAGRRAAALGDGQPGHGADLCRGRRPAAGGAQPGGRFRPAAHPPRPGRQQLLPAPGR